VPGKNRQQMKTAFWGWPGRSVKIQIIELKLIDVHLRGCNLNSLHATFKLENFRWGGSGLWLSSLNKIFI
jgi:hypothetical protein